MATQPLGPRGYREHYQKQQAGLGPSFSSFSSFVCSAEKELYKEGRRAKGAFSHVSSLINQLAM